ncbi:MAG: hypothetical protein M1827_006638 [Pycnora praestabilis]|nr:MAG: hypothetical protein M1827_006638 [Pycnora praestabilis]
MENSSVPPVTPHRNYSRPFSTTTPPSGMMRRLPIVSFQDTETTAIGAPPSPTRVTHEMSKEDLPVRGLALPRLSHADAFSLATTIEEEDELFDGVLTINTTPLISSNEEWDDGFGPSLRKIIKTTSKLVCDNLIEGGLRLSRVAKVVIIGRWDPRVIDEGDVKESALAIRQIVGVVTLMNQLESLEWKTELPFANEMWAAMNTEKLTNLFIDLFRPGVQRGDTDGDVFPLEHLVPLRTFTKLKNLTLVGMLDSYQSKIWEAVWLMPDIEGLDLRMAIEPVLRRGYEEWPFIQNAWFMRKPEDVRRGYHGNKGTGELNYLAGYGEYLDAISIMNAKKSSRPDLPKEAKLNIKKLTLAGFVVDAQPFLKCFSHTIEEITWGHDCIDAGLAMPIPMLRPPMTMRLPHDKLGVKVHVAKGYRPSDVSLVTLKGGKVIAREPAFKKK